MKMVICTVEEQKFTIVDPQSFFDQNIDNYNAHNWFFDQFTTIWNFFLNQRRFKSAEYVWEKALKFSYEWQEKNPNKKIHKGTPYYFWGVTCILNADLEKVFLLMHQALEEDKRTLQSDAPQTPAYYFVTLDYENQKQFFRPKVEAIAKFADEKLNAYRSLKRGALTLSDFKSKFLENLALREVVFYFVFTIFNLKKLTQEIDKKLTENVFSSLLQTNTLFDLCLIVENTIKKQNIDNNANLEQETMGSLLVEFLYPKSLLNIDGSKIKELSGAFKSPSDFSNALQKMLNSQYCFKDGTTLQPIEEDFAITYGFRNFGAHKIEDQPVVYKKFDEISRRILNALFFSVEKLYK